MTNQPKKATSSSQPEASTSKFSSVYFLSLEVERVLCFKDRQVLDLSDGNGNPAQWTVILGNNGVGKTTLLRCLASLENRGQEEYPMPFLMNPPGSPFQFFSRSSLIWEESQILHSSLAKITTLLIFNTPLSTFKTSSEVIGKYPKPQRAQIEISLGNPSSYSTSFDNSTNSEHEETKEVLSVETKTNSYLLQIMSVLLRSIQCYGYGATRRKGETSLSEPVISDNSASLFSDDAVLINAEEWLLQTDYAAQTASGQTRDRLQKQFDRIIEILKRILPDVEDIHIAPADEEHPRPRAEFQTPYGWVSLSSLGLGYRTMIAWMVDLAVRMFQRYPDSKDPLAEPAIVLVDEIDLHLHPQWQRTIMDFLTERFPNTQFIVTAHSPLVVQAAKDANIVLLRREGDRVIIDNNPEIIDNWRVDQVLTSVFELPTARPAKLDPLLSRRQKLLSKAKLTKKDEAELRELEAKIGSMPTAETPDDIKAMDIIRRAAKLLENSQMGGVG
jgi:predicted ATP-binding protein involved in virulence